MGYSENLKRILEIRNNIKGEYAELEQLKKKIVKEMVENGSKVVDIQDTDLQATLKWVVENEIDYDRLMTQYPDIYKLGIIPSFSKKQALNSVSPKLLKKILLIKNIKINSPIQEI